MKRINKYWASLVVICLHVLAVGYFYTVLPADALIPIHWDINGEIDGWTSLGTSVLFGLGMCIGLFLLMFLMPLYSPWYKKYEVRFEKILPSLAFVLVLFFTLISVYGYLIAMFDNAIPINLIMLLIGALMVFLGDLLPKAPRNFFIGIKTPWTLSDDDIWQKTHRVGGYLFVIAGFILMLKSMILFSNKGFQLYSGIFALALLMYPLLHSFILYLQKQKTKQL